MNYLVQTPDQLAPLLKAFRHAAGLTQADLAERLGITQQTYARLETDPRVVSLARFLRVLAVLDVQMALAPATEPAGEPAAKVAKVTKRRAGSADKAVAKPAKKEAKKRPAKPATKPPAKPPVPVISKRERW